MSAPTSDGDPATPRSAPAFRRAFWIAVAVVVAARALARFPGDDGLRHVGLAFGPSRPWGEVYPHSMFARFAECSPWHGYDLLLRGLAAIARLLPLPVFWQRYVVVELLVVACCGALLWLVVRRSQVLDGVRDGTSLTLALLVCSALLALPLFRAGAIRPFLFGSLLLIYSVGRRGAVPGFVSAALTSFLYPYLAWMYTGPVAVGHWLKGCRRFAIGTGLATAIHLALQPADFWGLLAELARSGQTRSLIDLRIREFAGLGQTPYLVGAALLAAFYLWPRLPPTQRVLRYEHVVMLLFAPVSLLYVRYFIDVQLTLVCVAHGAAAVAALDGPTRATFEAWLGPAAEPAGERDGPRRRSVVRPLLWVLYPVVAALLVLTSLRAQRPLAQSARDLSPIERDALVVTPFNRQYEILYARPDLSVVPSSEIGFVTDDVRDAYLGFLNRGRVCAFARAVGAAYVVEGGAHYLAPDDVACLTPVGAGQRLRVWRVAQAPDSPTTGLDP